MDSNYQTTFFVKHHTSADVSNSLLATNSENVNLSLPLVTLESINNALQRITLSFEVITLLINKLEKNPVKHIYKSYAWLRWPCNTWWRKLYLTCLHTLQLIVFLHHYKDREPTWVTSKILKWLHKGTRRRKIKRFY